RVPRRTDSVSVPSPNRSPLITVTARPVRTRPGESMRALECSGDVWLPGCDDRWVAGILTFSSRVGGELAIIGSLETKSELLKLLVPLSWVTMALHESGHWLAARAIGLRARFGVDRRLMLRPPEVDWLPLFNLITTICSPRGEYGLVPSTELLSR